MEELMQWYDQISSFERLKLSEAQELYKQAISYTDEKQKKAILDKIILGTLYVVYGYLERNDLSIFTSSLYDMNDIISAFNEVWVKKIHNGELLGVDRYSLLFTQTYFNEVYNNLCDDEIIVNEQFGLATEVLVELIRVYILYKNKSQDIDFKELVKELYFEKGRWSYYIYNTVINTIPLLENIYNNLNFDKLDDLNLGKTKINDYLRMIIRNGLVESISNEYEDKTNREEEIVQKIIYEKFVEDVDKTIVDDRARQIIHDRYGLDDGESKFLETVGNKHNITRERVRQIEAKTLRKLRNNCIIRNYRNEV